MQEFCHVVAYIAARKEVTDKVRRSLWRPEVMKKQLEELGREELWPSLSFVPGFDITTVVMEGGVEEDVLEEEMGVQAEVQEELLEEEQEVVLVREEGRGGEAEAKMEEMRSEIVETEGADMIEEGELDACNLVSSLFLFSTLWLLQGVPQHWTPEDLAKSQALYEIRHLENIQVSSSCL